MIQLAKFLIPINKKFYFCILVKFIKFHSVPYNEAPMTIGYVQARTGQTSY